MKATEDDKIIYLRYGLTALTICILGVMMVTTPSCSNGLETLIAGLFGILFPTTHLKNFIFNSSSS